MAKPVNTRYWSAAQLRRFASAFRVHKNKDLLVMFGIDIHQLKHLRLKMGLKKARKMWVPFAKGNAPSTMHPIGATRVKRGMLLVKVDRLKGQNLDWRPAHIHEWEKHNPPVPKGYLVCFKDGNRMNVRYDNLVLKTRAENMQEKLQSYPPELREVMQLHRKLRRALKEREDEKQDHGPKKPPVRRVGRPARPKKEIRRSAHARGR